MVLHYKGIPTNYKPLQRAWCNDEKLRRKYFRVPFQTPGSDLFFASNPIEIHVNFSLENLHWKRGYFLQAHLRWLKVSRVHSFASSPLISVVNGPLDCANGIVCTLKHFHAQLTRAPVSILL